VERDEDLGGRERTEEGRKGIGLFGGMDGKEQRAAGMDRARTLGIWPRPDASQALRFFGDNADI